MPINDEEMEAVIREEGGATSFTINFLRALRGSDPSTLTPEQVEIFDAISAQRPEDFIAAVNQRYGLSEEPPGLLEELQTVLTEEGAEPAKRRAVAGVQAAGRGLKEVAARIQVTDDEGQPVAPTRPGESFVFGLHNLAAGLLDVTGTLLTDPGSLATSEVAAELTGVPAFVRGVKSLADDPGEALVKDPFGTAFDLAGALIPASVALKGTRVVKAARAAKRTRALQAEAELAKTIRDLQQLEVFPGTLDAIQRPLPKSAFPLSGPAVLEKMGIRPNSTTADLGIPGKVHVIAKPKDIASARLLGTPGNQWHKIDKRAGEAADIELLAVRNMQRRVSESLLALQLEDAVVSPKFPRERMSELMGTKTPKQIAAMDIPNDVKAALLGRKQLVEGHRQIMVAEAAEKGLEFVGITETYFSHLFPGDFFIKLKRAKGAPVIKTTAQTLHEAHIKVGQLAREFPGTTLADFEIVQKGASPSIPFDVTRTSSKNFWRLMRDIAKETGGTVEEIAAATRGKIGTRSAKQKFAFFRQKRKGAEGFSKNYYEVWAQYDRAWIRHREVTAATKRVVPIIEALKKDGLPILAGEVEAGLQRLSGVYHATDATIDAILARIPVVGGYVRPWFASRWASRFGEWTSLLLLSSFRFQGIVNNTQLVQTLMPVIGPRATVKAIFKFILGDEKLLAALKRHRVPLTTARILERNVFRAPIGRAKQVRFMRKILGKPFRTTDDFIDAMINSARRNPFSSEARNQMVAWGAMYDHATTPRVKGGLGYGDAAAADFAYLRGQLHTQFVGNIVDQPGLMRGPFQKQILFKFKRFPIKNLELARELIRQRKFGGFALWLSNWLLLGGTKAALATFGIRKGFITFNAYKSIQDRHGEPFANFVAYGLPGLVNADLSASFSLMDYPRADSFFEAVGQVLAGPLPNITLSVLKAAGDTKGPEQTTAPERAFRAGVRRLPALRQFQELGAIGKTLYLKRVERAQEVMSSHDYDLFDPAGRLIYRRDLKEAIQDAFGVRMIRKSNPLGLGGKETSPPDEIIYDLIIDLKIEYDTAVNLSAQAAASGNFEEAEEIARAFNVRWQGMLGIKGSDVRDRAKSRIMTREIEGLERRIRGLPGILEGTIRQAAEDLSPTEEDEE